MFFKLINRNQQIKNDKLNEEAKISETKVSKKITSEDVKLGAEYLNQSVEKITESFAKWLDGVEQITDYEVILAQITQDIKSLSVPKGRDEVVSYIIFNSLFNKNIVK